VQLAFYNTETGRKEAFEPLNPPRVTMYTCGPTVWWFVHIRNFRTFLFMDILRRTLRLAGYQVEQVMNITDVDDRIIQEAGQAHLSLADYTKPYEQAFFEDLRTLGIEPAEHYPRATEHIGEMIGLASRLLEGGFAYEREGSVYFRVSAFPRYGELARLDLRGLKPGTRVDTDRYDKETITDFALWKAAPGLAEAWDSPWGRGRPGWHLECSAMAQRYLGTTLDLHAGGVDLIFPHHTNEIAQSEAASGKPFVRMWLHSDHLLVDSASMSKSSGNVYTLRELLERGYPPAAVRYSLLGAHYRSKLNFTFQGVSQAQAALDRLVDLSQRLEEASGSRFEEAGDGGLAEPEAAVATAWREALADDLNLPLALGRLFDWVRETNSRVDAGSLAREAARSGLRLLAEADRVLNCVGSARAARQAAEALSAEEQTLVAARERARSAGDFAEADRLRGELGERGIVLEDTTAGPRWKRVALSAPRA
jgi:cysteinyl-tRNA synthetase